MLFWSLLRSRVFQPANEGSQPTYSRANAESVIDVTFARLNPSLQVLGWKVLEDYSGSDHNYITYSITTRILGPESNQQETDNRHSRRGWAYRKMKPADLQQFLNMQLPPLINMEHSVDLMAESLEGFLTKACNACMPPRPPILHRKKPVHWWTENIVTLRNECLASRRQYQRAARRRDLENQMLLKQVYREKRKELTIVIRVAQKKCWTELRKKTA